MKYFEFKTCTTFRLLLIILATFSFLFQVSGQVTKTDKVHKIAGETVSPRLAGEVLQVLFDGVADLYSNADIKKGYYYITDRNGRLFTLAIPDKGKGEGQDEADSRLQGIIPVLKVVMQDAPALNERIESSIPGKYALIDLMHDYHVIIAGSIDGILYELPPPAFLPHIGFFAGYNADFLKADNSSDLYGFKMEPALYPSAGISFKVFLPRISHNLSLTLDLSVGKRYVYGYYNSGNFVPPVTNVYYELHLHNYLLMTDLQLGYSFNMGQVKPFISGGICTRTIISENSTIDTDVCYDGLVISDSYDYSTDEKNNLGVIMSLGLSFGITGEISLVTAVNYSELFVTPSYGSYRSVGVTIGANF
jgi:hypothetical protein